MRLASRRLMAVLIGIPVATLVAIWSNDIHHLFWTDIQMDLSGSVPRSDWRHGPLYWVWVGFAYALMLSGVLVLAQFLRQAAHFFRAQMIIFLIAVATPLGSNVIYLAGLTPWSHLDLTPTAFAVSGLAMALGCSGSTFSTSCRSRATPPSTVCRTPYLCSIRETISSTSTQRANGSSVAGRTR